MLDIPSYILGKKAGGGEGGTSNYNDLSNKPSINDVTLTGNKTTADLGIVIPSIATSISSTSTNTEVAGAKAVYDSLPTIATSISASSTNTEVAGAKAVYDNSLDVYSETEQRIGTWIDNKPLYRVVIHDTIPTYSTGSPAVKNIDLSTYSINTLKSQYGFVKTAITGGFDYMNLPLVENNASQIVKSYYHTDSGNLTLTNSSSVRNGATVYFILEYTKTTD